MAPYIFVFLYADTFYSVVTNEKKNKNFVDQTKNFNFY